MLFRSLVHNIRPSYEMYVNQALAVARLLQDCERIGTLQFSAIGNHKILAPKIQRQDKS